jgi:hypothetical protein
MAYHDCIFIPLSSPFEVIPLIEVCGRFYDTFDGAITAIGTHCSTRGWVENLVHSKSCYSSNLTSRGRLRRSLCLRQNMTSFLPSSLVKTNHILTWWSPLGIVKRPNFENNEWTSLVEFVYLLFLFTHEIGFFFSFLKCTFNEQHMTWWWICSRLCHKD